MAIGIEDNLIIRPFRAGVRPEFPDVVQEDIVLDPDKIRLINAHE